MQRLLFVALFALGFALAGGAAAVIAETGTTSTSTAATTTASTTTGSTTTASTTTGTTATTTTTTTATTATTATTTVRRKPPSKPKPRPTTLPARVRIGGVRVGGLSPAAAAAAVHDAFATPLSVVVDRSRLRLHPTAFARAYVNGAIARARVAAPGSRVGLVVAVRGGEVRTLTAKVARRFAHEPVDAALTLRNGRPAISADRVGRELDAAALTQKVTRALRTGTRTALRVRTRTIAPSVVRTDFRHVIVINRGLNRLSLYSGARYVRDFGVATGQSIYPTPSGRFQIVVMARNPWWYPPVQDDWAKGLKPVPPGPGNPLGTRWMGLSASGVGIHGTPDDSSIGYSASHGCIRMHIPDAEWLFEHVTVGTTVFIV